VGLMLDFSQCTICHGIWEYVNEMNGLSVFFGCFFCTNQILYACVVIVQSYSDVCGSIGRSRFNLKYLNFHFHYFDLYFYQLSRWKFSFHFRSVFLSRRTHGRDVFMWGKKSYFLPKSQSIDPISGRVHHLWGSPLCGTKMGLKMYSKCFVSVLYR